MQFVKAHAEHPTGHGDGVMDGVILDELVRDAVTLVVAVALRVPLNDDDTVLVRVAENEVELVLEADMDTVGVTLDD